MLHIQCWKYDQTSCKWRQHVSQHFKITQVKNSQYLPDMWSVIYQWYLVMIVIVTCFIECLVFCGFYFSNVGFVIVIIFDLMFQSCFEIHVKCRDISCFIDLFLWFIYLLIRSDKLCLCVFVFSGLWLYFFCWQTVLLIFLSMLFSVL